jgi:hypothetical protein
MDSTNGRQKVFGLGLSKTGTSSLGAALNLLGIKTVHWPSDSKTLEELRSGNYKLSVLEKYQGVVDIPVAPYFAQLDKIYPDSKFILTVREQESWLRSVETHWHQTEAMLEMDSHIRAFTDYVYACVYGTLRFNRDRFLYVFETHLRNVRHYFKDRPQDLLIMDISAGDGWERLCPFLGRSIPQAEFPQVNLATDVNKWMDNYLQLPEDIADVIPPEDVFLFADGSELGYGVVKGRQAIPFFQRQGQYWGSPPDDTTAIQELERLRRSGAAFIVIAWPVFWWFDHYPELHHHLRSEYRCVLENDRLVAFDLR